MTNHPGRKTVRRMTASELRDLIERAGLTQARAADLAGVHLRRMQEYLSDDGPRIPHSVVRALCLSLIALGAPPKLLAPWLHDDVAEVMR